MNIKISIKKRASELKINLPAVFLAFKEKEIPILAKCLAAITIVYALSPMDLIPDFIPVLGYLDDIILLPALIACTIKLIPDEVMETCRSKSQNLWKDGKPKKWYFSIPIIVIWVLILCSIFLF